MFSLLRLRASPRKSSPAQKFYDTRKCAVLFVLKLFHCCKVLIYLYYHAKGIHMQKIKISRNAVSVLNS